MFRYWRGGVALRATASDQTAAYAVGIGNKGYPGCDAIFHARSKDLKKWEVYSGEDRWNTTMDPKLWVPVITADNKPYDDWHVGDPSVVYKDGRFYMAFSATGSPGACDQVVPLKR